jgi:hypothetical protein
MCLQVEFEQPDFLYPPEHGSGRVHQGEWPARCFYRLNYDPPNMVFPPQAAHTTTSGCCVEPTPSPSPTNTPFTTSSAVWITYRQELPSSELEKLKSYVQGVEYILLSPYPKMINATPVTPLPKAIVVSSWGVQKGYENADPEIKTFLSSYANGPQNKAPENGSQCGGQYAVTTPDERAE